MDIKSFFNTLFDPEDHTCFAKFAGGTKVYPKDSAKEHVSWANFFCINPLNSTQDLNPYEEYHSADKPRRCDKNVTKYRNILIEMDNLSIEEQKQLVSDLKMPYTTAVFSGGKSIHYIISLTCPVEDEATYRKLVERVYKALGGKGVVDTANKNPSRLSRFPNGFRHDKGNAVQTLLEVNPRVSNEALEAWLNENGAEEQESVAERYARETGRDYNPNNYVSTRTMSGFTLNFIMLGAPQGERNLSLFRAACDFCKCGYDIEDAFDRLIEPSGLDNREATQTIKSAYRKVQSES